MQGTHTKIHLAISQQQNTPTLYNFVTKILFCHYFLHSSNTLPAFLRAGNEIEYPCQWALWKIARADRNRHYVQIRWNIPPLAVLPQSSLIKKVKWPQTFEFQITFQMIENFLKHIILCLEETWTYSFNNKKFWHLRIVMSHVMKTFYAVGKAWWKSCLSLRTCYNFVMSPLLTASVCVTMLLYGFFDCW